MFVKEFIKMTQHISNFVSYRWLAKIVCCIEMVAKSPTKHKFYKNNKNIYIYIANLAKCRKLILCELVLCYKYYGKKTNFVDLKLIENNAENKRKLQKFKIFHVASFKKISCFKLEIWFSGELK